MTDILTREQILGADDLKKEKIEVPEWGGCVFVRVMTGEELLKVSGRKDIPAAELLALILCDETGKALFAPDDIALLNGKNGAVLIRILQKALSLNGLTEDAVKDLEKN